MHQTVYNTILVPWGSSVQKGTVQRKEAIKIMSTKLKVTVIASSLAILLFTIVGGFVNVRASSNDGAYRQLSVYSEVLSRIRLEYVEEPNIAGVTEGALHGLLESLDANSSYLSAAEYKHYKTMKTDGKADIGATVSKRFVYAAVVGGSAVPTSRGGGRAGGEPNRRRL